MTDPARMLDAIRNELRTIVLPKIEGDYERSVVIAMLGILGDLGRQLAASEQLGTEADLLHAAVNEWHAELLAGGATALAREVAASSEIAAAEPLERVRRERFLEVAETLVRVLWAQPTMAPVRDQLLPAIRKTLKQTLA